MKKTFLFIATLLFLACSEKSPKITGTLTESDTAAMIGLCYYTNDRPVNDALVTLHDQAAIKKMVIGMSKNSAGIRSGTTKTNINGFFHFDAVDTGKYYVEVNDHDTLGALVEAIVKPKDDTVHIEAILKKYGTIKGTVDSTVVSNKKPTTVYIAELGRTAPVDSNGNFIIVLVPVWNGYTIRVVQNDTVVVTVFDTIKVIVSQDSVTQIGVKRNRAPVFAGKSTGMLDTARIGNTFKDTLHASDPDNDLLTFTLKDSVAGMLLKDSIIFWTPIKGQKGTHPVAVVCSDGKGGFDTLAWTIVIQNSPPVFMQDSAAMNPWATVGTAYHDTIQTDDPDGDIVTLSFISNPTGMTIDNGILAWIPSLSDTGRKTVILKANDGHHGEDTLRWTITIIDTVKKNDTLLAPEDAGLPCIELRSCKIILKGALPSGEKFNGDKITTMTALSAKRIGSVVQWKKPLTDFNFKSTSYDVSDFHFPTDCNIVFAVNDSGGFYAGVDGPENVAISAVGAFGCRGGVSCSQNCTSDDSGKHEPRDIYLSIVAYLEFTALQSAGGITLFAPDLVAFRNNANLSVYNNCSNDISVVFYVIAIAKGSESENLISCPFNQRWCQFASPVDNGTAIRSVSLRYQNSTSSFVFAYAYNNNSESSSILYNNGEKRVQKSSCCGQISGFFNYYPDSIKLSGSKTWSVLFPATTVTVIADSIDIFNWSEQPSLGPRRNPPPDLFRLKKRLWTPGS